jgi:putative transposase
MARLPRLALPGLAHLVIQRGHNGQTVFADATDREAYRAALAAASAVEPVRVHAWALLPTEVQLLATPTEPGALSRFMQAVNRRYVNAFNRRHGRSGTVWDGRFRAAVVEPGPLRLQALVLIDSAAASDTSAGQRLGGPRDPVLADPPEYWALGNTPFDREAAYRALLADGLPAATAAALRRAALGGWAAGMLAPEAAARDGERPLAPRRPGRPRTRKPG